MLQPRLSNCKYCNTIPVLLKDIDSRLNELSIDLYNNTIFLLNRKTCTDSFLDLITYKRILTYKLCNPDYAKSFSVEMIGSRVKLLKYK